MPQKTHPWNTNNRPAIGRFSILPELGLRPIQAEPVQEHLDAELCKLDSSLADMVFAIAGQSTEAIA